MFISTPISKITIFASAVLRGLTLYRYLIQHYLGKVWSKGQPSSPEWATSMAGVRIYGSPIYTNIYANGFRRRAGPKAWHRKDRG